MRKLKKEANLSTYAVIVIQGPKIEEAMNNIWKREKVSGDDLISFLFL